MHKNGPTEKIWACPGMPQWKSFSAWPTDDFGHYFCPKIPILPNFPTNASIFLIFQHCALIIAESRKGMDRWRCQKMFILTPTAAESHDSHTYEESADSDKKVSLISFCGAVPKITLLHIRPICLLQSLSVRLISWDWFHFQTWWIPFVWIMSVFPLMPSKENKQFLNAHTTWRGQVFILWNGTKMAENSSGKT